MKKLFLYAIVVAAFSVPVMSLAFEFRSGDQTTFGKAEQVANDLYMAGGSVTSSGVIGGDLVAGGGNIMISGDVGADVIAGGGNVTILSNVGDDVRVGGGNIVIDGRIGGDLIAGGGTITISGLGVGGDAAIAGGDIRIDAPIGGKVSVAAGSVFINAPIAGDIKIEADVVKLGSSAVISGNLTYKADRELVKAEGAIINGKLIFEQREKRMGGAAAIFSILLLWKFLSLLLGALLLGLVFRRFSKEIVDLAVRRPLPELGKGLIITAAMPIISILLLVTLVGAPLGVLGLLLFAVMMLISGIMTPVVVGSVVYRYFSKKDLEVSWKTITVGVIICTLLGCVPFIGWLAQALLTLLVFGCVATFKWRIEKEWR